MDFEKFYFFMKDKYKVEKAYLFIGYVKENESLYTALKNIGYTMVHKPALNRSGAVKGNCDAELVLYCMIDFNTYDKAIIVSGDGDFHCLIEYLKKQNKLYKIGIPNSKQYSSLLRKFSDYFFFISDNRKKLKR